jgi:hypothetical protein
VILQRATKVSLENLSSRDWCSLGHLAKKYSLDRKLLGALTRSGAIPTTFTIGGGKKRTLVSEAAIVPLVAQKKEALPKGVTASRIGISCIHLGAIERRGLIERIGGGIRELMLSMH